MKIFYPNSLEDSDLSVLLSRQLEAGASFLIREITDITIWCLLSIRAIR